MPLLLLSKQRFRRNVHDNANDIGQNSVIKTKPWVHLRRYSVLMILTDLGFKFPCAKPKVPFEKWHLEWRWFSRTPRCTHPGFGLNFLQANLFPLRLPEFARRIATESLFME
jgi:hypothetical protein